MPYDVKNVRNSDHGFTLVEILTVIALLSLLAAIVIVAINPSKQLADSRDAQRETHVFTILNALYQYAADYEGAFPDSVTTGEKEICATGASDCVGLADLSILSTNAAYLVSLPADPQCESVTEACAENGTGYFVMLTDNGRVQVRASSSENRIISVTQ